MMGIITPTTYLAVLSTHHAVCPSRDSTVRRAGGGGGVKITFRGVQKSVKMITKTVLDLVSEYNIIIM